MMFTHTFKLNFQNKIEKIKSVVTLKEQTKKLLLVNESRIQTVYRLLHEEGINFATVECGIVRCLFLFI